VCIATLGIEATLGEWYKCPKNNIPIWELDRNLMLRKQTALSRSCLMYESLGGLYS